MLSHLSWSNAAIYRLYATIWMSIITGAAELKQLTDERMKN